MKTMQEWDAEMYWRSVALQTAARIVSEGSGEPTIPEDLELQYDPYDEWGHIADPKEAGALIATDLGWS